MRSDHLSLVRALLLPLALPLLFASACDSSLTVPVGAQALYDTSPDREDFFALPFPSDARLTDRSDGKHIDLKGFHNPGFGIGGYIDAVANEPLGGFGTQSAIYFRFDAPLDPASLPGSAAASMTATSSVFLIDVTPGSPTRGKRHPLRAHFTADRGEYIGENWLALLPEPGFPLREKTTYTAVVTDSVRAKDGGTLRRDPRFESDFAKLDGALLDADLVHVVVATTFTTQDATSIMKAIREEVYRRAPAPELRDFTFVSVEKKAQRYARYNGSFRAPNFQEGDPPYSKTGGRIHIGGDGKPAPVRFESLRFALTIPHNVKMPEAGWPIVLYAHGTGGDWESFIDDGSAGAAAQVKNAEFEVTANMAMIGIDQVLHGPRDPTEADPELTFFNFNNIVAARDNPKQGALDNFQLLRLVKSFNVAQAPGTNQAIRFDPTKIYFKGHSQGGLTGPLFLAFEPEIKAAVLSGAGAGLVAALLGKTRPYDIPKIVEALLNEEVDEFHPLLNLLQAYMESSDPANYARFFVREPPPGQAPKNIYQSIGLIDRYTPVPTLKAFTLAMGLTPVRPEIEPIPTLGLTDLAWIDAPVANNAANGQVTAVACEYKVPLNAQGNQRFDGHYVVFKDPIAVRQSNSFLGLHATTGVARLIP